MNQKGFNKAVAITGLIVLTFLIISVFMVFGCILTEKLSDDHKIDLNQQEIKVDQIESLEDSIDDTKEIEQDQFEQVEASEKEEQGTKKQKSDKKESSSASKEKELSDEERSRIRDAYASEYSGNYTVKSCAADDQQFVLYCKDDPSVSILVPYLNAQKYLDSTESQKQKIKETKNEIIDWNIMNYSPVIANEIENVLKKNLLQDTEYRFHFQVRNPYSTSRFSYDDSQYWNVLSENHPIFIYVKILVDNGEKDVELLDVMVQLREYVFNRFNGIPTNVEIKAASTNELSLVEDYSLEIVFENKQSDFYSNIKVLQDTMTNADLVNPSGWTEYPGSAPIAENMNVFYESEKKEIREAYINVYKDYLGLNMETAEYGDHGCYIPDMVGTGGSPEDFFLLYLRDYPEISKRISYQSAEHDMMEMSDADEFKQTHRLEINQFLLTTDAIKQLKSELNQLIPSTVDYQFKLQVTHPTATSLYSLENEQFFSNLNTNIPLIVMGFVLFDEEGCNLNQFDLDAFEISFKEKISQHYKDLPIRVSLYTGMSSEFELFSSVYLEEVFMYSDLEFSR